MERLSKITICNYRAFFNERDAADKYSIDINNGQNVLIYGENGSGKSSFFKALEDIIASSRNEFPIEENIFTENQPDLPDSTIKINFTNNHEFEFSRLNSSALNNPFFNAHTISFLTYKDILNTYYSEIFNDEESPNLFNLFVNILLRHVTDTATNTNILSEIQELRQSVSTFELAYKQAISGISDTDEKTEQLDNLRSTLDGKIGSLNSTLHSQFSRIIEGANKYLNKYFGLNFKVRLANRKILKIKGRRVKITLAEKISLSIIIHGKRIKSQVYQYFLNEARLSALALSIYLSALNIENRRLSNQNFKLIVLDDIFIGLDTSNRIPLFKILEKDFSDFQIIITTYDRHWFETAKRWFNESKLEFKAIEFYVGESFVGEKKIESPLIIDKSNDYFVQAKSYYYKKDYPVAANYLRKVCERELKRILPKNLQLKENSNTGEIVRVFLLGKLFPIFKKYCENNDLDFSPFSQFNTYSKIVYNSLSHDDLTSPHYKKEIEEGIELAKNLKKIKSKLIINASARPLTISLRNKDDAHGTLHQYSITLKENLYWLQQEGGAPKFSKILCELITTTQTTELKFQDALKKILADRGYSFPDDYSELCNHIKVTGNRKLSNYMNFN